MLYFVFNFVLITCKGILQKDKCKGNLNLFKRTRLNMNHDNIKLACILVFVLVKCLYRVIMNILQDFQELRHRFSKKFSGNATWVFCQTTLTTSRLTLDGVKCKILEFNYYWFSFLTELICLLKSHLINSRKSAKYSFHKHYILFVF